MKRSWICAAACLFAASCATSPPATESEGEVETNAVVEVVQPPESVAATTGPESVLDPDELVQQIKRYFAATEQVSPGVGVEVTDLQPSSIDGLELARLRYSLGTTVHDASVLVSSDGRWLVAAEPIDLTVDWVRRNADTIEIGPNDPTRGPTDAAVTIVEYSDFQCPFCARAEAILQEEVLKEYGDEVRFVYKQFPLGEIHAWAETASVVGLCVQNLAGDDTYWKYHTQVFAGQRDIEGAEALKALLAIAAKAGAKRDAVESCFELGEMKQVVAATRTEAARVGVDSTPTFFINGRKLSGAQPLAAFRAVIDPELAAASRAEPSTDEEG